MADFQQAFDYMMANEDGTRSGVVTHDPTEDDPNAVARLGINSAAHPELLACDFFNPAIIDAEHALVIAEGTYKYSYFVPIGGYSIICQDIANKFFDLAVNEGTEEATKIVQRACNQVLYPVVVGYMPLTVDGVAGSQTRDAINRANPENLLPVIKTYASQFYKDIALREHWTPRQLAALLSRVQK